MKMKNLLPGLLALVVVASAWAGGSEPAGEAGVAIELKGAAGDVSALVAKLEKNPVHKAAACGSAKTAEGVTKIDCAKADNGLMVFLGKNAPTAVQWSIASIVAGCLPGCAMMKCPPPSGPLRCCNTATYAPC